MDATQAISDSILESDEEEIEEDNRGQSLAKLCILENDHIPKTEIPLYLGDNVLGRDDSCSSVHLPAPSVSKQHATISIIVQGKQKLNTEALIWDLGSLNGTRKGRLKLTPHVRYAISEGDGLVVADIPCRFVRDEDVLKSLQGNTKNPGNKSLVRRPQLPDPLLRTEGNASPNCVRQNSSAAASLFENVKNTPVGNSCLSFEKTPNQPHDTLVPESDSDSEGESRIAGETRRRALVSVSDSHLSSPNSSTFLSPANKIVPESEDEMSTTPASATINGSNRNVPFGKDESDIDVRQQQPKNLLEIVDDSDEEGTTQDKSALKESSKNVEEMKEDEVEIPEFHLDSDTDVEEEEEGVILSGPVVPLEDQNQSNTGSHHLDSDTDVEEEEEGVVLTVPVVPLEDQNQSNTGSCHLKSDTDVEEEEEGVALTAPVVSLEDQNQSNTGSYHLESDTDVEEEEEGVALTAPVVPLEDQNQSNTGSYHLDSDTDVEEEEEGVALTVPVVPLEDQNQSNTGSYHLDSDTDVEEEEEGVALTVPVVPLEDQNQSNTGSYHLDSDTDVEEEEEGVILTAPVVSLEDQNQSNTGSYHLDSDTDVESTFDDVSPSVPLSDDKKPPETALLPQPAGFSLDSDTDVDDEVSESAAKAEAVCSVSTGVAESAPSTRPKDFHFDSDTDVDDEEDKKCESGLTIPRGLHMNSDTDDEVIHDPCGSAIVVKESEVESCNTEPFGIPSKNTGGATSAADSDADTDVSEPPNAGGSADLKLDSDTDVETEVKRNPIISSHKNSTCTIQDLHLQSCSTPVPLSGNVDEMETQAFLTPQKSAAGPDMKVALSPGSDSFDDEDLIVAETQSFVLTGKVCPRRLLKDISSEPTQAFVLESSAEETDGHLSGDESFKLGLSESSHLRNQVHPMAMESTRLFGAVGRSVSQEETQVYSHEDLITTSNPNLDAIQTESSRCPVMVRGSRVELAMQETQAFILEHSDSDDKHEEDEYENPTLNENQHLAIAMAETQPMCAVEENNSSESDNPDQGSEMSGKLEEHTRGSSPCGEGPSEAEAKPRQTSDEDTISLSRRRRVKPLQGESKALSISDTQPVSTNTDSDGEDSMPIFRKRKSQPLHLEDESQSLNISDTQLINTNEDSDDENSMPILRKRKAKSLQLEDDSQPISGSDGISVEIQPSVPDTQPMQRNGDEESENETSNQTEDEDRKSGEQSNQAPQKRKGKRLRKDKKYNTEIHLAETQPIVTHEDDDSEDEKEIPGFTPKLPHNEKSKNHSSAVEGKSNMESHTSSGSSRPARGKTALQNEKGEEEQLSEAGTSNRSRRVTRTQLLKEAESSRSSKVDVKDNKPTTTAKGRRTKLGSVEMENVKPDMEQVRQSKRKKNKRQLAEEEEEELEKLEEERAEKERKEKLEQELIQAQQAENERLRLEKLEDERIEKERQEKLQQELAAKERLRLEKMEEERIEKEKQEKLEQERLQAEQAEKERLRFEKIEEERIEKERQEKLQQELAEKERLRLEKMEEDRIEKERQENLQQELAEKEQKKTEKERQERLEQEHLQAEQTVKHNENSLRGRRAAKRTVAGSKESKPDLVFARVTRSRSRSNSSNSVTSETSASSVNAQATRGRGRGAKKTNGPAQTPIPRYSSRRRTVAAAAVPDSDISSPGVISRSNSSISLNSEVSNSSSIRQNRGRGGRQGGCGRKSAPQPNSFDSVDDQDDSGSTTKSTGRGGRTLSKAVEVPEPPAATARGQRRPNVRQSTAKEEPSIQEDSSSSKSTLPSSRTTRGRSQKIKTETTEVLVASAVKDESQEKRRGRKRELQESAQDPTTLEEVQDENPAPTQTKRRGRQSNAPANKTTKVTPPEVEVKEEMVTETTVQRRGNGRTQVVQKKENADDGSGSSEMSQPQTPVSQASRKRQAPVESSPVAKTPRASAASPAGGRPKTSYKVLYTGVVDEAGEKVLTRLGGTMAKGVADMNCLVTDKVRRTVKFLCAVAKGIPVVTTSWLEKSGKAGSFLSTSTFIVKDPEQEKKFNFSLAESLRVASNQPLLQGFEIHITKSVKPEPVYMKDILSCSGATFLPKMPSSHKPQTVVISCEEDCRLCAPAFSASIPVVSAEFILSGILQQKVDLEAHKLCAPAASLPATRGRGKPRKKS